MPSFNGFKKSLVIGKDDNASNSNHEGLLAHVRKLKDLSHKEMARMYSDWDYHDQIFRSKRDLDRQDQKALAKKEPTKLIVPLAFSQIMTFVAFAVQTVTQNSRFFELEYEGNHDPMNRILKESLELILERDLRRNKWNAFLVQFFLDVSRFWVGCAEVCYKEEYRNIRVQGTQSVPGIFGTAPTEEATDSYQQIPTFIGNRVYPISPYRFFPDTRLPLTRFQEGEFCASEDMFSMSSLRSDAETLFNLDKIPKMSEKDYRWRRANTRIEEMAYIPDARAQDAATVTGSMVTSGAVVVTKMVFDVVPNNFEIDGEKVLGTEKFPVRYICWYANDKTIIRFEEAYYLHGQFPYIAAQYMPDQQKTVNEGLSSVCDQITNLITWKLNAHLQSQKNSVRSKFVVDPAGIDTKNLDSDNPYIFLKKNASSTGVDRWIKQFVTTDVTAGVMQDVAALKDLLEGITGISGAMQGQYSSGRRSATQDRVVAQGASARAKTTLSSIWDEAFEPLGKQLLANNRQEMDEDTFYRIVGPGPFGPDLNVPKEILYQFFKSDPVSIATAEDFFVFDGTTPSEKAYLAQSLQEIFMLIMQNPTIMQVLGYGPEQIRYLFNEIYELRGVTPPNMPQASPQPQAQPVPLGSPESVDASGNPVQQQQAVPQLMPAQDTFPQYRAGASIVPMPPMPQTA